jgi:hypothetical protein
VAAWVPLLLGILLLGLLYGAPIMRPLLGLTA